MARPPLPRTVRVLGFVSMLNDASSEMIYPLLPAFLATLGAGPAFLGLVEGLAEAVAAFGKLVAGEVSDRLRRRKPLVVAGYGLASFVRPLIAAATAPWHVLAIRFADRVGKGARGAPRDALLAEVTPDAERGRAFGFHRAMDHLGAAVGPLLASAVLLYRADLRFAFALASVPALLSVALLVVAVREAPRPGAIHTPRAAASRPALPPTLVRYLVVLGVFTLGNSSDAFLLLRAQESGVSLALLPALWSFHHVVKSAGSTPLGALSDRFGRRRTILGGWAVYAVCYAGFAAAASPLAVWLLFGVYGLHHAATEGPERALVADLAGRESRGRAFGWYHATTGAMLLPASLLTGLVWQRLGAAWALGLGAGLAAVAALALLSVVPEPARPPVRESA